ncbi:MAG: hypothetical protein ABI945_12010, partial [Nitrospirales bacterium]
RQGIRAALQLRAHFTHPPQARQDAPLPEGAPSSRARCASKRGARMSLPLLDSTLWGDWSVESPMGVSYDLPALALSHTTVRAVQTALFIFPFLS